MRCTTDMSFALHKRKMMAMRVPFVHKTVDKLPVLVYDPILLIHQHLLGGSVLMYDRFEMFTARISSIYRCIQKIKSMEMTEFGLKGPHVMCLFHLGRQEDAQPGAAGGGLTAGELCALCGEDKAAISRSIAELEEQGYLLRSSADGKKAYRAKIRLTPSGKKLARQLDAAIVSAVSQGGADLSEEERAVFYRALTKIESNLRMICRENEEG